MFFNGKDTLNWSNEHNRAKTME